MSCFHLCTDSGEVPFGAMLGPFWISSVASISQFAWQLFLHYQIITDSLTKAYLWANCHQSSVSQSGV